VRRRPMVAFRVAEGIAEEPVELTKQHEVGSLETQQFKGARDHSLNSLCRKYGNNKRGENQENKKIAHHRDGFVAVLLLSGHMQASRYAVEYRGGDRRGQHEEIGRASCR